MEYDLKTHVKPLPAINPDAITSATDGEIIDSLTFNSMTFIVSIGDVTSATTLKLEHGDAEDLSDKETVDASDIIGEVPAITTSDDDTTKWFGYIGKKRYVRLSVASGDATLGAVALLGHPNSVPTE